jgi:nicotinate-nucleotide adenylyltransferase
MLALATADDARFMPSLLESTEDRGEHGPNYTIDTVRRFKKTLGKSDRGVFLIGIDAFLEIAHWRDAEALLGETEFIVVSRPGFSLGDVGAAFPERLRPPEAVSQVMRQRPATGDILLPGVTVHLLEGVVQNISATRIRSAAEKNRPLDNLVGAAVANYIRKQGLYRGTPASQPPSGRNGRRPAAELRVASGESVRRHR